MPTVLKDTRPKARRDYRCLSCEATISAGTTYRRTIYVGDDGIYVWIVCDGCDPLTNEVWDWAGRPDEGIGPEEIAEWANDSPDDPAAIAFLGRLRAASGEVGA